MPTIFATFNRETGAMWLTLADGTTRQVGTARRATEAGAVLAALGAVRHSDWTLVASGSPMRQARITLAERHDVSVVTDRVADHGYPHRAVCTCGWKSWGYVRTHAAETMADHHRTEVSH